MQEFHKKISRRTASFVVAAFWPGAPTVNGVATLVGRRRNHMRRFTKPVLAGVSSPLCSRATMAMRTSFSLGRQGR
jgi:hypothetical protein